MHSERAVGGRHSDSPVLMLQVGGVSALLLAAAYLAIIALFATVGAPPGGAQARLEYHATTAATWWAIVALSVITDLLFVPVAVALYAALRGAGESAMRAATVFTLLFVVLDLAVTWPAYASLISLSQQYATVTTVDERAVIVAAAGYPSAVLSSPMQSINSILTLSIGILLTGLVTVRGAFGRATGTLGVTTGLVGIASVAHTALTGELSPLAIAASVLTIAWLVLIGVSLSRPRRSSDRAKRAAPGALAVVD